jgi:uncharacterized protein
MSSKKLSPKQQACIDKTADYMKERLAGAEAAHDWWHVYRVWRLASTIAAQEKGADRFTVELGALLHDIADWKFHDGDLTVAPKLAGEWLASLGIDEAITTTVLEIVEHISYRGGTNKHAMQTLEGRIVQDADRLDAIGAIGIARTFTFGGSRARKMYNPDLAPQRYKDFEDFQAKIDDNSTINHFYEKLLLLKEDMHTSTARAIAEHRHQYMETFLTEFYDEWEGRR